MMRAAIGVALGMVLGLHLFAWLIVAIATLNSMLWERCAPGGQGRN